MSEEFTFEFPTKPIAPTDKDPGSMLIYGSPKIGKTSILSGLPGNFLVDIEGGSKFVEALKMKVDHPGELDAVMDRLIKEKPYKFTTYDTVTKLEEWCEKLCTMEYKKTPQGAGFTGDSVLELDYGAGYGLLRNKIKKYLYRMKKTSDYTIFVGHVKDKIITKNKSEVSVKDINLIGQIKAIVTSDVDAVGYIYIDPDNQSNRLITFFTSDEITCGNRCPHLEGQTFVISEKQDNGEIITHWNKIYSFLDDKQPNKN